MPVSWRAFVYSHAHSAEQEQDKSLWGMKGALRDFRSVWICGSDSLKSSQEAWAPFEFAPCLFTSSQVQARKMLPAFNTQGRAEE